MKPTKATANLTRMVCLNIYIFSLNSSCFALWRRELKTRNRYSFEYYRRKKMEPKRKSECHLMKIAFNGVFSSLFFDAKKHYMYFGHHPKMIELVKEKSHVGVYTSHIQIELNISWESDAKRNKNKKYIQYLQFQYYSFL